MSHAKQSDIYQRRRKYFVDPAVQGALIRQAIVHWVWTCGVFAMILFIFRVFPALMSGSQEEQARLWYHMSPYILGSVVLFPIVVLNALRLSNRFAGPMVRVRRTLKELGHGDTPAPLKLRGSDFWNDIADDINAISARIVQLKSERATHVERSELNAQAKPAQETAPQAAAGVGPSLPLATPELVSNHAPT